MTLEVTQRKCNKLDCTVAESGTCIDGHIPLEACPSYGKYPSADSGNAERIESIENDSGELNSEDLFIPLYHGELLNSSDVEEFLRSKPALFISIIGDKGSGKTTLITSIYEKFRKGHFSNFYFSGSRTLIGFEKSVHFSRIESRLGKVDTKRTSFAEGLKYFHLSICSLNNINERNEFLFSDRAGEAYKNSRGNTELIKDLTEIPRADRILLLLDGARIADFSERSDAMQSTRQMLRALVDNDAIGKNSIVQVVTTKIDILQNLEEYEEIGNLIEEYKEKLKNDFQNRVAELSFWEIAARDPSKKLDLLHGVDKLLLDWISDKNEFRFNNKFEIELKSEFDRLVNRTKWEE
ncbi:hypothetical protein [Leptospira sp. id769339]|uniref:TRAFAC clade GTPase domain-containing protein n=1 Tax=Leptospira sp. id769339 TaxID=2864221 RepID=UPI00214CA4A7|nr:hypothetical protein [Leptospira sp. id769339]MCR1795579.1 hypothetical protein [Leptospira sp. id769339]